jgi:hypothetical protein
MGKVVGPEQRLAALQANYETRLSNLAQELAMAGMQVLASDFGFSQEEAARWLERMLAQAKANREQDAKALFDQWSGKGK